MRHACVIVALACACACKESSSSPTTPTTNAPTTPAIRVLMLTATAGFRHDSIATAREVMSTLALANGLGVTPTEDLSRISAAGLSETDVVMFALTSGELAFSDPQRAALIA